MSKRLKKAGEVAKATMRGDLRDVVLDIMKDPKLTGKAWKDMNEAEQRQVAETINNRVETAITRAVDIISSEGRRHVKVTLKQVTVKDGIKGVFECIKSHELRHELIDAQGDTVLVVIGNAAPYLGQQDRVKFDKDQKELPVNQPHEEQNGEEDNEEHDPETGEILEYPEEESDEDADEEEDFD